MTDTQNTAHELKPCPFCGGNEYGIEPGGQVWHGTRGYSDPQYFHLYHNGRITTGDGFQTCAVQFRCRTEAECIDAWNTRAETDRLVAEAVAAALEEAAIFGATAYGSDFDAEAAIRALTQDPSILAKRDARRKGKLMTKRNHTLTDETLERHGRTFYRIRHADGREGGWAETIDCIPPDSTARFYRDALCFKGGLFKGGEFMGGTFQGGTFWGGEFMGGTFRGGTFRGGMFQGGLFKGGEFMGGTFWGGEFMGGTFWGGEFMGGTFRGGEFMGSVFYQSPCCAQRSDRYMFVAKYVDDDLRIWAGCRNFSWDEAVAHWNDDHPHGAESQRIIHFLKAQAEAERERDSKRKKADD